jgi:hypothetical protein
MTSATTTSPPPTALERHASFFDPEGTGFVTWRQTYRGMRRLGVHLPWRVLLTPVINGFLGALTQGHASFVIRIDTIAKGKHPYDSGTFDARGELDPTAFDALFADGSDAVTASVTGFRAAKSECFFASRRTPRRWSMARGCPR